MKLRSISQFVFEVTNITNVADKIPVSSKECAFIVLQAIIHNVNMNFVMNFAIS
ncbi:MAG: hypothetical protein RR623_10490 [Bacilli bacterium]